MVEQRWLRTANDANGGALAVPYTHLSPSMNVVIDEVTESFFAAPLLSIDESVLRAFPVDPFDVARTRRRPAVSVQQAEQLVAPRSALDQLMALPAVRTHFEPELGAPATYAAPSDSDRAAAPSLVASVAMPAAPAVPARPVAFASVASVAVQAAPASAASRGWLAGGLLALAGIFVGGALVCAALTRTEARIEPLPSATAALQR